MKLIGHSIFCLSLLIILSLNGCTTYRHEVFLKSHSLDQFMADRPQAANLLHQHPALEQWLRTEWARPTGDYRVYWNNEPPVASSTAEHVPEIHYHIIVIRVSKNLAPVDQLLALSYEMCNAQGRAEFDSVTAQAAAGTITRKEFVDGIEAKECDAILRLKECFPKLLPLSSNEVATTTLYCELLEVPAGFYEYQAWCIRTHSQNYLHAQELYGNQYDQLAKKRSNP
jgi:hypothetical protein